MAVLLADPVALPLALPHDLDHLAVPAERIERGGVDDDLVALLCVHPASSGRRLQGPALRPRSPGPIACARPTGRRDEVAPGPNRAALYPAAGVGGQGSST